MGRPHASQSKPKNTHISLQHIGPNDSFSTEFIRFLLALPSNSPSTGSSDDDSEDGTPRKRARVERFETIPVATETLTLKRPAQSGLRIDELTSCLNFHRFVKINRNENDGLLAISSIPKSPYGAFKVQLYIGNSKLSKSLSTILEVLSSYSKWEGDGVNTQWVSINAELVRIRNRDQLQFTFQLNWNSYSPLRTRSPRSHSRLVLDTFFGELAKDRDSHQEKLSPQAFYDATFVPDKDHTNFLSITTPKLKSRLYPFQRRALQWLLMREGVRWSDSCANGEPGLEPFSPPPTSELPLSFSTAKDMNGRTIYVSDLFNVVTTDITPFQEMESAVKGGILAEEMGLGKTVETISLICMHMRGDLSHLNRDELTYHLRPSGATLIVTPATLKNQWVAEFSKHAPQLRVMVYDGLKGLNRDEEEQQQLINQLVEHDVVLTTYNVLQTEIHYAAEPPGRSMRFEKKYTRPKSPLIQISWWRVCLDEAQQVESGVSNAAKVATLIPRINAWGITGTPVKQNIKDLWGLLVFLHYEPFASSTAAWERLISSHKDLFKPLFKHIALRHTKRLIRDELKLPSQKRYIVTMPFTTVEEQHYQEQFKQLINGCGFNQHGTSLQGDLGPGNPYPTEAMRTALAQLRQSILHPSLGPSPFLGGTDQKTKALRTVDEVLDAMIEQSESSIRTDQRNYLIGKLEKGQIFENQSRMEDAIAVWQEVVDEVEVLLTECREQLQIELERAKRSGIDNNVDETVNRDTQDEVDPENEENAPTRVNDCRRKLRSMLDIHHRAIFFIASGYYQMKSSKEEANSDPNEVKALEEKEVADYEKAKNIRKEILQDARSKALTSLNKIREKATKQEFVEIPGVEFDSVHGLESMRFFENFQMLGEALDQQAGIIDDWRETVIQLLIQPLVDEDDETEITGDEYNDSTKLQDELMVYTLVLRAAIADRQDAISGLENERIKYDTRFATRQAKEGEGHAPEKTLELLKLRNKVKPASPGISLRGVITDLRELATQLRYDADKSSRARVELEIVERQLKSTQGQSTAQTKAARALERELDAFTAAMNSRVEFYRQLQGISDTVTPLDLTKVKDLDEALGKIQNSERRLQNKLAAAIPKHRYFVHLKETGQDSNECCIICQSPFTLGVLTVCGHQFCKECITFWLKTKHACPVCKKVLTLGMLHDITLKKQELRLHEEGPHEHSQVQSETSPPAKSLKSGIYSEFGHDKLGAIKSIDLDGPSFGTKINTLAKHLLWLRVEDPGAKSVIFSQFGGFLDVLSQAFDQNGIGHSSFSTKNGIKKFKEDPAIECFLMDARSHASGLNLVNASHVFLCEPVLNTALELQAIARVDRIGQEHETTVWLYLIDGTVEENIHSLSVQRRLKHLDKTTKDNEEDIDLEKVSDMNLEVANSMELQKASLPNLLSKGGKHGYSGEVIDKDDLWQCLFGRVAGNATAAGEDERMNNPAVIGFLAGEAAEARRQD
ncbi:hypothetical protein M426DRAFT_319506 [Hypoxylon sp. CI-4A]|nr:hypothetical protein M426DRAFT_319506 [Hypoxylon sp. CI-4A]